ncbi:MAG: Uma2 family endonuclease [Gammaproteobacteria bacterium]|nr:Uma2 family endonuclease [Gammaproteobacteria bacterium]
MMAEVGVDGVPEWLTADPVAPDLSWEKGSLGSVVLALKGGDPEVLKAMAGCYAKRFRKSWRDLRGGLAVFMAPSRAHERRSRNSSGLVEALCAAMGLPVVALASTTLHGRGSGRQGEPDESFYVGEKAAEYQRMERSGVGEDELDAWADGQPADLVVEVEHTHYEAAKRSIYRDAGIRELWEIVTPQAGRETAITNLQGNVGAEPVGVSEVVPGVCADGIKDALDVLREIGGLSQFMLAMGAGEPVASRVLDASGVEMHERAPGKEAQ